MLTDPVLQQIHTSRHHADSVRDGVRERLAGQVHPWYGPVLATLIPARASVGAGIIRLGRAIQGAAAIPASRRMA